MSMPVSICIIAPSYNHANYIEYCINSIINAANYDDFTVELIIIDDASRDGTADIAKAFLETNAAASKLKKYSILRNKFNHGAHANYNRAIGLCDADVIHFMNTDDAIEPKRLKAVTETYRKLSSPEQKDLFWGFGSVELINEEGEKFLGDGFWQYLTHIIEYSTQNLESFSFHMIRDNLAISTGNIFVSTSLAKKLNGFNPYLYVHDWDFILRCLLFAEPNFLKDDDTNYLYRHHQGNTFKELGNHIGVTESYEVIYRFFRNVVLGHPKNKKVLSVSNYGSTLLSAWLVQHPGHKAIVKNLVPLSGF